MELPDYQGGSIVNLMRSIERALDARPCDAAIAYPESQALPASALAGARNIVLLVIDGLGYDYLNITATRGPLKDVRVRQAISWAVDRSQVLRVAASGFGRLTPPATAPMKEWQLPEDAWMKYYKPDIDRAKKLLADAGHAQGFTVKCSVIPTFPTMVAGAPVIAAQLKRIGITMEIENVEYAIWIKRWLAKDFDMTMNTTPGYADPDTDRKSVV